MSFFICLLRVVAWFKAYSHRLHLRAFFPVNWCMVWWGEVTRLLSNLITNWRLPAGPGDQWSDSGSIRSPAETEPSLSPEHNFHADLPSCQHAKAFHLVSMPQIFPIPSNSLAFPENSICASMYKSIYISIHPGLETEDNFHPPNMPMIQWACPHLKYFRNHIHASCMHYGKIQHSYIQISKKTSQELRMLSPSLFIQGSQCKC